MQEFKLPKVFNWQTASNKIPYNVFTANIDVSLVSTDSGLLVVGKRYLIQGLASGDDFTNVGFPEKAFSGTFTATGTTPNSWVNGTLVYNMTDSQPTVNELQNTIGVTVGLEYGSFGLMKPAFVLTFRKTNGFPESKMWYSTDQFTRVNNSLIISSISDFAYAQPIKRIVLEEGAAQQLDTYGYNNQYEFKVYN